MFIFFLFINIFGRTCYGTTVYDGVMARPAGACPNGMNSSPNPTWGLLFQGYMYHNDIMIAS